MKTPAWLFVGPELGERKAAIQNIKDNLLKQHPDLESHRVYAYETPVPAILEVLQSGTLFSSARLVIVGNAELIKKKDDVELLHTWITTPHQSNDAFLILESDETAVSKKIQNAIPSAQRSIFWELFENKKQNWVRAFFAKHTMSIQPDAIEGLLARVENNTDALKMTCSQIALFFDEGTTITPDDIEALLAHNREESPFSLFDALTHQKNDTALAITQKLLLAKNSSAVQIIAGLSYCFRRLIDWHDAHRHARPSDVDLKGVGFSSARARAQYSRAARLWNKARSQSILATLNQCDMHLRSSSSHSQQLLLEQSILAIIGSAFF